VTAEADLLAEILADPLAEAPRLVYADLLLARGDPRGELIITEHALAGRLTAARRETLARRRQALRDANAATWWPYHLDQFRTRAGFIVAVRATLETMLEVGPTLFASEPVTDVEVTEIGDVAALTKARWLSRVRRLTPRGLDGEGFGLLVRSKQSAGLRALNVCGAELDAEALGELGANLPSCRSLALTGIPVGDEGAAALARWRHLDQVEVLYLARCELSPDGVNRLLDTGRLRHLEKLCLGNNDLGDAGVTALARRAESLPALRHLELDGTGVRKDGCDALARAAFANLAHLDLRKNYGASTEELSRRPGLYIRMH
jgi:uncharacterized protein (TIGR02996 family)